MSTLQVVNLQNPASGVTNGVLNSDGSTTIVLNSTGASRTGGIRYNAGTLEVYDGATWVAAGGLPVATLAEAAAGTLNTVVLTPETGVPKDASGMTGAALLPSGTTAQRPGTPAAGMTRLNTDTSPQLENYDGTDWAPIGVITSNLTLNVATTGNDATGLGTAAAPWATPHKAMSYLSNYAIAEGVVVTVSVADGAYTFTTPLNLSHPDGDRIFINGGTTTGVRPTGAALDGGGVAGNTPATEAFNDALLKAYYNTQWQFNGCNGLVCSAGGNVTVNTVLIRGDASNNWYGVLAGTISASSGGINLGDTVAVHNFLVGIATNWGGSIDATNATVTNNINGIQTSYGGSINAQGATASNNNIYGIVTSFGGSINATNATASYNNTSGIRTQYGGAAINAQGATASNNGVLGISTNSGGCINASNATATGNGTTDVFANRAGIIVVNGATYGTISPALDTVGNLNAATSS